MKPFFLLIPCTAACMILGVPSAPGQDRRTVQRLREEIVFDGVPDEPAWNGIDSFPMITQIPVFGPEPSERSVIKMAFDEHHIYVGASLYVSDPSRISTVGKKRDMNSMACDWFGVSLDTYNDKENALLFFTNPNGLRWDASLRNDGTPAGETEPMDLNWNTFWDARTRITDEGWFVEMRIPVSSLRFQEEGDRVIMGLSFFRYVPALNEGYIYPAIPVNWGPYSNLKVSQYAEVEFETLNSRRPLYISPYLLAGYDQEHHLNGEGTDYVYEGNPRLEPGLDVKLGINPNTILDLTVNTDFAQVESDDQQFNLTRFSLVYPEKRPFFLERSSIFDFGLGGPNTLFYSRRIGLHEGSPVRIWGGARLNSRVGEWDIGMMELQTATFEELPSENFGIFRFRRRILNQNSYAGGMVTSRIGTDGSFNVAWGVDAVLRLFKDDYLTVRWAQTFADSAENNPFSLKPTRFLVNWEKRKQEGFTYNLFFSWSGTGFDPGIGLEVFDDYFKSNEELRYVWISPGESRMHDHYISLMNYHLNDVSSGELITWYTSPGWSFSSKGGWYGTFNLVYNYERLTEEFEILDPVMVPAGNYHFFNSSMSLITPMQKRFSTTFSFEGGEYYDGVKISPSVEPLWNLGSSLELGGIYRFDRVSFPGRDKTLNNHIAGIRALWMLSTKISFSAFLQYNTAIRKVISNVKFRYNPREGTDLYVVFNEGRNTYLKREIPALPAYEERNITVKFTYTFDL